MDTLPEDKKRLLERRTLAAIDAELKSQDIRLTDLPTKLVTVLLNVYITGFSDGITETTLTLQDLTKDLTEQFSHD